jgi:tRNA wybutosine-synthesizing protein 4
MTVAAKLVRSPALHHGYAARHAAVGSALEDALRSLLLLRRRRRLAARVQVLSLGAGFDTAFFRLKAAGILDEHETDYFEVDMPNVMRDKTRRIEKSQLLAQLKGRADGDHLRLVSCDLCKTEALETLLSDAGLEFSAPTVVLFECSLTYVSFSQASDLLRWLRMRFKSDLRVISYEQVLPCDRFGVIMRKHFSDRATPILNVEHAPSVEDQERRLRALGFHRVRSRDLLQSYWFALTDTERKRLAAVDPDFDELEEVFLKCGHYAVWQADVDSQEDNFASVRDFRLL